MEFKKLKTDLQREILLTLILNLRRNKISKERGQNLSKAFLETIKSSKNSNDLINNVSDLCQKYPEIVEGYLKTARLYEEENVKQRLSQIKILLKGGVN